LICVDDFNAAKRFSTFAVNTAQRSASTDFNPIQRWKIHRRNYPAESSVFAL